jgi:hypothetical protein
VGRVILLNFGTICTLLLICITPPTNDHTPPRSKYSIGLGEDLDDAAVSLLIKQGLGSRFSTLCDAWKSRNAESEGTAQKSIFEEKRRVDEQLKNDQPLLEDTLARGIISRILDKYPYVLLSKFHMSMWF